MNATTIYSHPDGHEIAVGHGLLTACTSEGTALSLPIGPDGLAELGAALIERSIAEKHGQVTEKGRRMVHAWLAKRSKGGAA